MKSIIAYLIIFLSLGILIGISIKKQKEDDIKDRTNWQTAIGTIIRRSSGKYTTNRILYSDKEGHDYERPLAWDNYGLQIGDKFRIKYDPNNPEDYTIYTHKPVFSTADTVFDQKILITTGELERVYSHRPVVLFSYEVQGEKYERNQDLPPNFRDTFPDLKEGNIYRVVYLSEEPKRAIILLSTR